jgi:hypothetical protein
VEKSPVTAKTEKRGEVMRSEQSGVLQMGKSVKKVGVRKE